MFDPSSRYAGLEVAVRARADGRTTAYVRRRFLPRGRDLPLIGEVAVQQGERLDLFTARTLGDPLHFWRVCDANDAMHPLELVAHPARLLRVPLPRP
jgi:hypothetical protein